MSDRTLRRELRRLASLVLVQASEPLFWFAGRRGPYGVLRVDLSGDVPEEESAPRLLSLVRGPTRDFFSLIALLRWARDDARLAGVLIRCDGLHASWARLQDLRRSIERLRQAGKRVWVHITRGGLAEYYLACAAERVSLAPAATLEIAGLSSEATFFFGALEKLGVQADIVQMGRYKAAAERLTRRDMSLSHREMMESLVDDLYGQVVDAVAAGRPLEPAAVRAAFDRGPFLGREALDARLVDQLAYDDAVEAQLVAACGGAPVIDDRDYARRRSREIRARAARQMRGTIGLLHIAGTIKSGASIPGPDGTGAVGTASVAAALKELRERADVRAIVVRVASSGGGGGASDAMWREIARAREGKPVVVSFGDVAASGGYYVALAGAPVLAEAGTITGSIGVVAGKATLRGLYDRVGVTKELVSRGRHAALYSDYEPLGSEERARIQAEAESFYETFVAKVAAARRLTPEAVAAAAEGRVWTGRQAWTRGLVDRLGGLEDAIEAAKTLAGLPAEALVPVERFPRPRRLWKLPVGLYPPGQGAVAELVSLLPWLRFVSRERVWAMLPFQLRFF
jgi:protease-4